MGAYTLCSFRVSVKPTKLAYIPCQLDNQLSLLPALITDYVGMLVVRIMGPTVTIELAVSFFSSGCDCCQYSHAPTHT